MFDLAIDCASIRNWRLLRVDCSTLSLLRKTGTSFTWVTRWRKRWLRVGFRLDVNCALIMCLFNVWVGIRRPLRIDCVSIQRFHFSVEQISRLRGELVGSSRRLLGVDCGSTSRWWKRRVRFGFWVDVYWTLIVYPSMVPFCNRRLLLVDCAIIQRWCFYVKLISSYHT